jgi:hypothetical protein
MAKPTTSVVLNTSLSPVAHGVLMAFAQREDPAHAEANGVITRMLREELDRLAPGAWDDLVARAALPGSFDPAELSPREVSVHVASRVGAILRAKAVSR